LATLAVLAADKADAVDRRRVSRKNLRATLDLPGGERITDVDIHAALAALVKNLGWSYEESERTLYQLLQFTPGQIEEELRGVVALDRKNERYKVKVPDGIHHLHRDLGIPHLLSWLALYLDNHQSRLLIEAQALFALFPDLNKFALEVQDSSDFNGNGGICMALTINRESVREIGIKLDDLALKKLTVNRVVNGEVEQEKLYVLPGIFTNVRSEFLRLANKIKVSEGEIDYEVKFLEDMLSFSIHVTPENREQVLKYLELLFTEKPHRQKREFKG